MGYITSAIYINPQTNLSSPLPQNKNEWVHSVIFEPQLKIQLTRSSYKVTSFLDFQPFLRGFQSVNEYLKDLTRHSEMLCERDTKMFVINKTLQDVMWSINVLQYESDVLHSFQTRIYRVHTSLYALRGDTESLYEYMRALASQELNPMIIPPDILKRILSQN